MLRLRSMKTLFFATVLALPLLCRAAPPPTTDGSVKVTITPQRKMIVEAWVNGVRGSFLVDTGAGNSYLGARFASSLRVQRSEGGYSHSVLGMIQFDMADVDSLELGSNRVPVRYPPLHVSDLGWVNRRQQSAMIHGIIGADILIRNRAVIDCAQSFITLGKNPRHDIAARSYTVNFRRRLGDELAVVARINGMEGLFIVDTGYNVSLISPEFAARLGNNRTRSIRIASLELGRISIPVRRESLIVSGFLTTANQGYRELGETPYDGVLGMDFLLTHRVVLDCERMRMSLD